MQFIEAGALFDESGFQGGKFSDAPGERLLLPDAVGNEGERLPFENHLPGQRGQNPLNDHRFQNADFDIDGLHELLHPDLVVRVDLSLGENVETRQKFLVFRPEVESQRLLRRLCDRQAASFRLHAPLLRIAVSLESYGRAFFGGVRDDFNGDVVDVRRAG